MTDNEIIKALECIASEKDVLCKNCAYNKYYLTKCHKMTAKDALDLIKRQKELIEKSERVELFADKTIATLQAEIKKLNGQVEHLIGYVKTLKAEKDDLKIELQAMRNAANGYKAEVERLKNQNDILSKNADTAFQDGLNEAQDLYAEQIKNEVKAEAVKEFAERLKAQSILRCGCVPWYDIQETIDNLLKETVGDANDLSNRA